MELLTRLEKYSKTEADVVAFKNAFTDETITYSELWSYSDKIARHINETVDNDKQPIVVYGHKSPLMLAAFLACVIFSEDIFMLNGSSEVSTVFISLHKCFMNLLLKVL